MSPQPNEELKPCGECGHRHYYTDVCGSILNPTENAVYFRHCECDGDPKSLGKPFRRAQEAPVAQVEVYRKALEEITHCGLLATEVEDLVANAAHVLEVAKEALLTSKPEPVAQDDSYNPTPCENCGKLLFNHYADKLCTIQTVGKPLTYFSMPVAPVRKWEAEDEK